jgi:serine/threonine-protein kinase
LLVAEHFAGVARPGDARAAAFMGDARRISTLASPNLGRVRELALRGDDLVVFWDFIDGEKLIELGLSSAMSLEVALRLILDVLSGAGAIHTLRDAKQQPMHLAHGELSSATIVLGADGVARVLHTIARRAPGANTEGASLPYVAPEVHAGGAFDARADMFSAGVLLWEALSGKRLFEESDAAAIASRVRRGGVPPVSVPESAPWARGLAPVVAKALAWSPDDRWPTAAVMAAEIRKVVGLKLAPASAAAAFAKSAIAERVRARRERLESSATEVPHAAPVERQAMPFAVGARRLWADDEGTLAPMRIIPVSAEVRQTEPARVIAEVPESLPPSALTTLMPEHSDSAAHAPVVVAPLPPLPHVAPDLASANPELTPFWSADLEARKPATYRADEPSGSPYFAAAIDVPISVSVAPPSGDRVQASDRPMEPSSTLARRNGTGRRRTQFVLGGVGALGLVVFGLAGWRAIHRNAETAHSSTGAGASPVALSRPAPATAPMSKPIAPQPAPRPPSSVAITSSRTAHPPDPPTLPRAYSVSAPAPRKTPAPTPPRTKPRPGPGFDPNSL